MGWLAVVLGGGASYLSYRDPGLRIVFWIALASTIGCFWSWGVMHNYATEAAKRRAHYTGGFYDLTALEANAVPDGIARVNTLFSLISLVCFVIVLVRRYTG